MSFLALLVLLSAIAISVCGAYFSIVGLKLLFVGGGISIIIMGAALEIGKIIAATFLKQKWNEIGILLKTYLVAATIFLMGITSIGIYGYLSAGYTTTSIAVQGYEQQIELNKTKIADLEKEIEILKKSDHNIEEINSVDFNRKKFIEQKLQIISQKNQQIDAIRKSSTTTQDASVDINAAKQALELSKSATDGDIARELEQIKLYNSRLEILDKEVQKWIDQGTGGLFRKNGLDQARSVKEAQSKERSEIDAQIKDAQQRITTLRDQYSAQVKQYNERVFSVENRSTNQRGEIDASIKRLEKENEETMISIDTYNKEADTKIALLNGKKEESIEDGRKKILGYITEIQNIRNQNTDIKDKVVKTDVGTFKFIANTFGIPLDKAVNYFIWSIMAVFDPLAIALILAYNSMIGKRKNKTEEIIKEVPVEVVKEVVKEVPVEVVKEVVKEVPVEVVKEVVKEVPVQVIKYLDMPQIKHEITNDSVKNNFTFPFLEETKEITGSEKTSEPVNSAPTGRIVKPANPYQPPPPPEPIRRQEHFSRPMR